MAYFAKAKWPATRRVIDISGDGTSNSGRPITEARDQAIAAGVTINGLAIINDKPNFGYSAHTNPPGGLPNYYRQNVIGGAQRLSDRRQGFQLLCRRDGEQARQGNQRRRRRAGQAPGAGKERLSELP